jgi:hypothetical protein
MKTRLEFLTGCGLVSMAISLLGSGHPTADIFQLIICVLTILFSTLVLVDWIMERKSASVWLTRYLIGPPDEASPNKNVDAKKQV